MDSIVEWPDIYEYFEEVLVPPEMMDRLWEDGWRHFGTYFYRYSKFTQSEVDLFRVIPLRLVLQDFIMNKSQQKTFKKINHFSVEIKKTEFGNELLDLFYHHRERFTTNKPESLHDFFSEHPAEIPCVNYSIELRDKGRLAAVSFLDIGATGVSSVYAMFHHDYASFRPGILTMLIEIEFAKKMGMQFYYPGYAYIESSYYDYKKQFIGLEYYDWETDWRKLT